MELKPEQLTRHLQKGLAPVYLISGDEPLRVQEAADAVRARAREEGYHDRQVMNVDRGFDWSALSAAADSLSLFAERRLIELRIPSGKPGDGTAALAGYAADPPADTVLLVVSGKIEQQSRNTRWYKALTGAGVGVTVWPLKPDELPGWVKARMQRAGLKPTPEAVSLLAERSEGNLLACAQEIDKLALLHPGAAVDAEQVAAAVADSARFDAFLLVDTLLAGDLARGMRILDGLRGEGLEPPQVLWALAREVRGLAAMAHEVARGERMEAVMARHKIWNQRLGPVGAALRRQGPRHWLRCLRLCARIDRAAKGRGDGNPWDELVQLAVRITQSGGRRKAAPAQS